MGSDAMGAFEQGGMPRAIYADEDEDDVFDLRDERPLSRARRRLPWLRMTLFSGLCIAALAYLAQQDLAEQRSGGQTAIPATILVAPPPAWTPLVPARTAYGLDKTLDPVIAEARQHSGGGREDTLIVGALGEQRYVRVIFSHGIPPTPRSFYVDIVRRAAEAGLSVERNAQTAMLPTKFGPVESAAVTLAGSTEQNCQAFRFHDGDAAFGFQGWLCGSDTVDIHRLACFIDGVTLSGASDPALTALFARAGRAPPEECAVNARTAAIGAKASKAPSGRTFAR